MSDIYETALKHDILTKERELELCTLYAALRDAHGAGHPKTLAVRNKLVASNLRAIARQAKRYKNLPFDDLMGEGVKGMIIAVERFEPERGWRLATYAQHWIRHSLQRACENDARTVRVPVHQQSKLRSGAREADGIALFARPVSLDEPLSDDGSGTMYDKIADDADEAVDELGGMRVAEELRRVILATLSPREREIIEARFLRGGDETLQSIGERIFGDQIGHGRKRVGDGLSRERIRQVEREALQKLRLALSQRHSKEALL